MRQMGSRTTMIFSMSLRKISSLANGPSITTTEKSPRARLALVLGSRPRRRQLRFYLDGVLPSGRTPVFLPGKNMATKKFNRAAAWFANPHNLVYVIGIVTVLLLST